MEHKAFETHYEEWAAEKYPEPHERAKNTWILAAVRAHRHWGEGKEVSRSELETAIDEVLNIPLGGGLPPEAPPKR